MSIEIHHGCPWIFGRRSCGTPPTAPLHEVLVWVLQQLRVGHFVVEHDDLGDGVSLTIGQAAAVARPMAGADEAPEYEQRRLMSLTVARLFAGAREHWWPNDVPPSQFVTHRHVYHACKDGAYVAVSTGKGETFYWRPQPYATAIGILAGLSCVGH